MEKHVNTCGQIRAEKLTHITTSASEEALQGLQQGRLSSPQKVIQNMNKI